MNNKVEILISGDDKDALRAWQRQGKEIDKLNTKLEKVGRSGKRAARDVKTNFDSALDSFKDIGSTLIGIGSASAAIAATARVINEQHETMLRRQNERAIKAQEFGNVMRGVRIAFGEDNTLKNKGLEDAIQGAARRSRTDPNIFAQAMVDTFSAKQAQSNVNAIAAQEAAFMLKPGDLESGRTVAARALDLANNFGVEDMRANIGFIQNVQAAARITDLEKVGSNLLPGMIATTQYGDTPEQAAELGVTLSRLATDAEGRLSRTALIAMAQQLEEFMPTEKGKDARGEYAIPADQIARYEAAKTTTERVQAMQQSPGLQRQFLADASFEKTTVKAVESLLKGTDVALKQFADTQSKIQPLDLKQAELFNQKLEAIGAGKFEQVLQAKEKSQANVNLLEMNDTKNQIKGTAFEVYKNTMEVISDLPATELTFGQKTTSFNGRNVPQRYLDTLEDKKRTATPEQLKIIEQQQGILRDLGDQLEEIEPTPKQFNIFKDSAKALQGAARGAVGGIRSLFRGDEPAPTRPRRREPEPPAYNRFQDQPVFNAPAPATPGIPTSDAGSGVLGLMQQQVSLFGQILEEQKRQGRGPLTPARPAPFKLAAERLNRGAG